MALEAVDRAVPAGRDAPARVALRRCAPVSRGATRRRPAADVGFAPADEPRLLDEILRLLCRRSFGSLGLVRLDTRVLDGDADAAPALDRVGFVFVGFDRRGRHVWSVVPNLVR